MGSNACAFQFWDTPNKCNKKEVRHQSFKIPQQSMSVDDRCTSQFVGAPHHVRRAPDQVNSSDLLITIELFVSSSWLIETCIVIILMDKKRRKKLEFKQGAPTGAR